MPDKGPTYILLRVGKLSLSNPFVLYSNVLSILQGACDKHGVRCVRALDVQVLATLSVCYSGLSLDLGYFEPHGPDPENIFGGISYPTIFEDFIFAEVKAKV